MGASRSLQASLNERRSTRAGQERDSSRAFSEGTLLIERRRAPDQSNDVATRRLKDGLTDGALRAALGVQKRGAGYDP